MHVVPLMSRPVVTCGAEDSARRAARSLWEEDPGAVVVLDATRRIVGLAADRDLCMAASTRGVTLARASVRDVMSRADAVIGAGDRLAAAEALMRREQPRRLPVVDSTGQLVGVDSLDDVARAADEQRGRKNPEVGPDGLVTTRGARCEPRRRQHLACRA